MLAVATGLAYRPVLDAGFLNWDHPPYVTRNPNIRTLCRSAARPAAPFVFPFFTIYR